MITLIKMINLLYLKLISLSTETGGTKNKKKKINKEYHPIRVSFIIGAIIKHLNN